MLILGIETSCDETAAALIEAGKGKIKVLSNMISSQVKLHAKYGGVVPSLAAREHVKNLPRVLDLALQTRNARYGLQDIKLIAVTAGPGLVSSLLVGTAFAKTLAWKYNKPLVGVNHLEGHIFSNWLEPIGKVSNPKQRFFPAVCLVVSGGHTQLVLMHDFGKYELIGETLDDAAGEAFDKIARILGLGYPGGPAISAEAKMAAASNKRQAVSSDIKLPRPMINSKNFNFSFSGLKTAVLYFAKKQPAKSLRKMRGILAQEVQNAIVDVLVDKTAKAALRFGARSVMLSGGVSANTFLRQKLGERIEKMGVAYFCPSQEYTTDNAAMIAATGYFKYSKQKTKRNTWSSCNADPNLVLRS